MTTAILRPNGTNTNTNAPLTGGATTHGVLSDDSDSTYVIFDIGGSPRSYIDVALGTFTLPAGAVTKSATLRIRATGTNNLYTLALRSGVDPPGATASLLVNSRPVPGTYATPPLPINALTQAQIDALNLEVTAAQAGSSALDVGLTEVYVNLTYATLPTVTVAAPTGVQATSAPTVTWSYSPGSDGGPQAHYRVKVFSAAAYGAGGFDPWTATTATYDSGTLSGSVTSHTVANLLNSTTYRAYVWGAQLVNGQPHWSTESFSGFSTTFTVATVTAVTPTASSPGGYISVVVSRSGGTAWESIELQRSEDGGTTWLPVRGATAVAATNAFVTAWSTSSVTVRDYEAPNGTTVTYRARALRTVSSSTVVGPWVTSSTVSWSSTDLWLKNPHDPAFNTNLVAVSDWTGMNRPRATAVHSIEGRPDPIVVSGILHTIAGTAVFRTLTTAAGAAFEALVEATDVVLIQAPAGWGVGSKYIAGLQPTEERTVAKRAAEASRLWEVSFVEVAAPSDQT